MKGATKGMDGNALDAKLNTQAHYDARVNEQRHSTRLWLSTLLITKFAAGRSVPKGWRQLHAGFRPYGRFYLDSVALWYLLLLL